MQQVIVVNMVPRVVRDTDVQAKIPALQKQFDRDFFPAWKDHISPVNFSFMPAADLHKVPVSAWPIFLNKHSTDPGALGWHDDQSGKIFSRVFVGDCIRFGLDWGVTLSHEALELILDPDVSRTFRMSNGQLAALEVADACEADDLAYEVEPGQRVSDFVLPAYFSTTKTGPFDFGHHLKAPCPALTPGGYMSITDASGQWTQIYADKTDGLASRRAIMKGWRRQLRCVPRASAEVVPSA